MRVRELKMGALAAALSTAVAAGGIAGCGSSGDGDGGGASATTGAPLSVPAGFELAAGKPRDGKHARLEPLASARGVVRADASSDLLAMAIGGPDGLKLYVGPAKTAGPLDLHPAAGAGTVPYWARVHVGTDADGRAVVTYPRCSSDQYGSCTGVAWSPEDRREHPITGFAQVGGVLEAVEDHGTAAVRVVSGGGFHDDRTRVPWLLVRPAGSYVRKLAGPGPYALALHGDTLAVLRTTSGSNSAHGGVCGQVDAALWSAARPDAAPRSIDKVTCGMGGQYLSGVDVDEPFVRLTMAANGEDAHSLLRTHDPATGKRQLRELPGDPAEIAWIDATHGIAIGELAGCGDRIDVQDPPAKLPSCPIDRITLTQP